LLSLIACSIQGVRIGRRLLMIRTWWLIVVVGAGLAGMAGLRAAGDKADKRKDEAKEVAEKFVKAVGTRDLDAVLRLVDVPFAGSMTKEVRAVLTDKEALKKTLQNYLAKAKAEDKELKVRRIYTYAEFAKDKDGAPVVEFLGPVFEKLGLAKDDVIVVNTKGTVFCVRIRDGKAKLAALFK